MTPQELKASILQLAIQGKLVEQRPEEGSGGELLKRIFAAKNAKNAKGAKKNSRAETPRRRGKADSLPLREEIPDSEKPFDIPESWVWVRLGECTNYADKKAKILPKDICPETWSLDLEDIEKETGKITNFRLAKDRRITGDKVLFHKGEILYSKLRPYLKKILVAPKGGICTPELVPFSPYGDIDANYLVIVLKSPSVDFAINSVTYGVKMPRVGTETMLNLLIPLPPLAEQKRIVAKIEELLPYIDRYEKAWSKLEDFNKRFPGDMQKSLLQMAIQGKLVYQRPDEGTGEELYRQIQSEKQRLVKSGKIKKEKPLPEITPDEIPFDIPESWKWVRIGKIFNLQAGKTISSAEIYQEASPEHVYRCYGGNGCRGYVAGYNRSGHFALIGRQGALCGNINYAEGDFYATEHAVVVEQFGGTSVAWCGYFLKALNLNQYATATAQPGLAVTNINQVLIPLPPLAEQKRIVAKLKELLPLCERLK